MNDGKLMESAEPDERDPGTPVAGGEPVPLMRPIGPVNWEGTRTGRYSPGPEMVPCRFCSEQTRMTGTRECDDCHEVRIRVKSMRPGVLLAILKDEQVPLDHPAYWQGWEHAWDSVADEIRNLADDLSLGVVKCRLRTLRNKRP